MNVKQIIRKFFLFCGMMVFTFLMISDSSYASETDTNQTDGDEETNRAESECRIPAEKPEPKPWKVPKKY